MMRNTSVIAFSLLLGLQSFVALADDDEKNHPTSTMVKCIGIEPDDKNITPDIDGAVEVPEKECMDKKGTVVEPD